MGDRNRGGLDILARCLLTIGLVFIGIYAGSLIHRSVSSRMALREFDRAQATSLQHTALVQDEGETTFRFWSEKRRRAYLESRALRQGAPVAVLSVAKLNLRAPVFEGTDEWTLNRGVGWIAGTARPGDTGNIGIAGHRDGFFRGLKDVSKGDVMELSTAKGTAKYAVDEIEIVNPDDVGVLRPRAVASLTLVTCYPFYFIGDAPKRFILHAALVEQRAGR
jgi:sortase A